jgi:hypothetical protein
MAMADAEHNSVRRRLRPLPAEGEADETGAAETDTARNLRPKPLNTDATTTPTPYFGFLSRDRSLGAVLNGWMTKVLPCGFLDKTIVCRRELISRRLRNKKRR